MPDRFLLTQFHCAGLRGNYLQKSGGIFPVSTMTLVVSHPVVLWREREGRGNPQLVRDTFYASRVNEGRSFPGLKIASDRGHPGSVRSAGLLGLLLLFSMA